MKCIIKLHGHYMKKSISGLYYCLKINSYLILDKKQIQLFKLFNYALYPQNRRNSYLNQYVKLVPMAITTLLNDIKHENSSKLQLNDQKLTEINFFELNPMILANDGNSQSFDCGCVCLNGSNGVAPDIIFSLELNSCYIF